MATEKIVAGPMTDHLIFWEPEYAANIQRIFSHDRAPIRLLSFDSALFGIDGIAEGAIFCGSPYLIAQQLDLSVPHPGRISCAGFVEALVVPVYKKSVPP